jgi:hypothetical protein
MASIPTLCSQQHIPIFDQAHGAITRKSAAKSLQHHTLREPRGRSMVRRTPVVVAIPENSTPHTLNIAPIVCNVNRNRNHSPNRYAPA